MMKDIHAKSRELRLALLRLRYKSAQTFFISKEAAELDRRVAKKECLKLALDTLVTT